MSLTIGILGGGQLAKMLAQSAYNFGFKIKILEKVKNSPAAQMTHYEYVGWVENEEILFEFAKDCSVILLENEFIDPHYLMKLENKGFKIIPSSRTLEYTQDKLIQKQTFAKNGLPVPEFYSIESIKDFGEIVAKLSLPFVLKSRKMGYDGYGNALIKTKEEFLEAFEKLSKRHSKLYAEKYVRFSKELAAIVVRSKNETKIYPIVETIQKSHICHTVIAPAQINQALIEQAARIAVKCVESVEGYGAFGVELFLTEGSKILINEIAPRVHNSGHYSIEACYTSQFENCIRAALNYPLGSVEMIKPYAVMINLLGKVNAKAAAKNLDEALKFEKVKIHIYGKEESRVGRKMGHITIVGDNLEEILTKAKKAEEKIII